MKDKPKLTGTSIERKVNKTHDLYSCPTHSDTILYKEIRKKNTGTLKRARGFLITVSDSPEICPQCKQEGKDVYSYYKHECLKK